MAARSRNGLIRAVRRNVDLRFRTLEDLTKGQRNPVDRRLTILERRRNLISAVAGRGSTTTGVTENSDQSNENSDVSETEKSAEEAEESESDKPTVESDSNVNIEINSPPEEALQAADILSDKHPNAEEISIVGENRIRVKSNSVTEFTVDVAEILERETEDYETGTVSGSVDTMSEAAENRR
jgi:hypothetical protein